MVTQTTEESLFHAGERAVQQRAGARNVERLAHRLVHPTLPEQHRSFYASLPFLVVAARDELQRPWVTLLAGPPGFVSSADEHTLQIDAHPVTGDALAGALGAGTDVGLLGIEPATRRRNRANGRIRGDGNQLVVAVEQAFGNCPKHIRQRQWRWQLEPAGEPQRTRHLTPAQQRRIAGADTFFIASGYRGRGSSSSYGMDASHRGGDAGFVRVEHERRIEFPDYAGNNLFNTLGNLLLDNRVGLLFIDFAGGGMLQLSGRANIDFDSPRLHEHPGARRLIGVDIDAVVELPRALPLRWR